ncbi:acetyl-CoA carboxylase, carboxyltransferase subunit beta [Clostridium bowmanii]|uniref:acetyl-CoA carboxylase, carboxyltransferase subunit beta n=1 Tax=Clostridium bowmanii TaxID=132925 RepID=UPI001C0C03A4|nr:acetyl-CoA carboxylase, carboxyltransferase subunit beta [Clostridium bowmanii]MBU3188254.1 acetyl-CoA carboxylase, carboxyltransferase subunit beta [Clostridium bowmanii]MCA1072640.1 acetyl-CoA carboxylase, carboxyltransferase subunit beta [Clostridium bowmanii]
MAKELFRKTKYMVASKIPLDSKNPTPGVEFLEEEQKDKPFIPDGMWDKCDSCGEIIYIKDLEDNLRICPRCETHLRVSASDRIKQIVDDGTFKELDKNLRSANPLDFPGYEKKILATQKQTDMLEAVITGKGKINDIEIVIAVMDSRFMMGSMGSAVGEKITRAVEKATKLRLPIIIFTASGGARMQEGIFSLMQMAKVSAAIERHSFAGLLYITVLTDPTTGGVTASFAMLGDIIFAEPGALIGFAGKRVIEQTIKQKLPAEFQRAEFLLEHGFVDEIISRHKLRETLGQILFMHKEVR